MTRSLTAVLIAAASMMAFLPCLYAAQPNIIFILADDLGYAELGCYGQTKIKTPNIDKLAGEGLRFTQYYSGHPVCAPSRCALLTGFHSGHGFVRDNREVGEWTTFEGQLPLPDGTRTLGHLLKERGYATGCVGKWGLGAAGSTGEPHKQGFDFFFGYNCQRHAHNYYPTFLMKDREQVPLEGNTHGVSGKTYAADVMCEEALNFIQKNKDRPFFLYFATPIPHVALQVPEDSLAEYADKFDDQPYDGKKGYQPHPKPRAAYAAMITRMDRDVGRIMKRLKELGLDENTIVFFASDNGPTFNGGTDSEYFKSAGGFRGLKQSVYEGGVRVPFIARWPGKIPSGKTSDHICAAWDILPTVAELVGAPAPTGIDGISLLPTLLDKPGQKQHEYLYWESSALLGGEQGLRMGEWKGVRRGLKKNPNAPLQLFNLKDDPAEASDLATTKPEITAKIMAHMKTAHTPSKDFPLFPDEKK